VGVTAYRRAALRRPGRRWVTRLSANVFFPEQGSISIVVLNALMNVIPLILTAAVTISTIVYTFYSFQLWRTTRVAAEISRQAAFSNLWAELNRYLELLRQQNAPEVAFLEKLSNLLLEYMFTNLIRNAAERNEQSTVEFRQKVSRLVEENKADASRIPWASKLAEWQ
jgi:hypothetical protein